MPKPSFTLPSELPLAADPGALDGSQFGFYKLNSGAGVVEDVEGDLVCVASPATALWIAMVLNWAEQQPGFRFVRNGWLPDMAESINASGGTGVPDITTLPELNFL